MIIVSLRVKEWTTLQRVSDVRFRSTFVSKKWASLGDPSIEYYIRVGGLLRPLSLSYQDGLLNLLLRTPGSGREIRLVRLRPSTHHKTNIDGLVEDNIQDIRPESTRTPYTRVKTR